MARSRALILFAHGSREPEWAAPFRTLQKETAARRRDVAVELAFLELMQPTLPDAVDRLVAAGRGHITIAPLFMAQGAHLKQDLAQALRELRKRHADVQFKLLPAAGEVDAIIDATSTWLAANS
ncbi:MAG TPA: CbiX/SirB N-terminal domain-containing protein [Burkholderiales bacterium]|nr:CbiX/SirB N-terminal domain-containing protein [Burkholderiales bacterium]